MAHSDLVQSVAKALDVLKYIASCHGGCKLCDLAAHFGMKPPALHNILRTMVDREFLRKSPGGLYFAGEALQEIAGQLPDPLADCEKIMGELRDLYPDATITVAELTPHAIVSIRRISPDEPGLIQIPANRIFPPYCSVTGLVTLSHAGLTAAELEARWPFEEFGAPDWRSREELSAAFARCREEGYAVKRAVSGLTAAVPLGRRSALGILVPGLSSAEEKRLLKTLLLLTGKVQ